jgi:hypothetical protein
MLLSRLALGKASFNSPLVYRSTYSTSSTLCSPFPDQTIRRKLNKVTMSRRLSSQPSPPSRKGSPSASTSQRKPEAITGASTSAAHEQGALSSHTHSHSHDGHDHSGHSHSLFSTHTHDHSEGAAELISALSSGRLDRGTKITLLGLASNVALTGAKGAAGIWMNSASLLAEAGHSLSDLLGDFVTLATWRISRRPPSPSFPWGYSKVS